MSAYFTGTASPEQLQALSEALDRYCASARIERGTVEHRNAAALLMNLFTNGVANADELVSAAGLTESRRKAEP